MRGDSFTEEAEQTQLHRNPSRWKQTSGILDIKFLQKHQVFKNNYRVCSTLEVTPNMLNLFTSRQIHLRIFMWNWPRQTSPI